MLYMAVGRLGVPFSDSNFFIQSMAPVLRLEKALVSHIVGRQQCSPSADEAVASEETNELLHPPTYFTSLPIYYLHPYIIQICNLT